MEPSHSVAIRVFCNEKEDENEVLSGLKWLLPLNTEEEKISIRRQTALGLSDNRIIIFEAVLNKKKHIKAFLDYIVPKISEPQKQMVARQLDSRIGEDTNFFIRFDKEMLLTHKELLVTDGGSCYHIKIKIAAFPSTKEKATEIVKEMLSL